MSSLAGLTAARLEYRVAVQRARELLQRQEVEYARLCERLERAQRDLRAAGYLREPRPPAALDEPPRESRRWNKVIERAQLRIARELGRRRGGPSSGVPGGHHGHHAVR